MSQGDWAKSRSPAGKKFLTTEGGLNATNTTALKPSISIRFCQSNNARSAKLDNAKAHIRQAIGKSQYMNGPSARNVHQIPDCIMG